MDRFVEVFNRSLLILARNLVRQYPTDPVVGRTHQRIVTVVKIDPLLAIGIVGPYLMKYADQVYALEASDNAEQFFLENSFDAEIREGDKQKADTVMYLIPKVKECARSLPAEAKKEYKQHIIAMLDNYLEYKVALAESQAARRA
jgi:hypothetical protein